MKIMKATSNTAFLNCHKNIRLSCSSSSSNLHGMVQFLYCRQVSCLIDCGRSQNLYLLNSSLNLHLIRLNAEFSNA